MILDRIESSDAYAQLHPGFAAAFEFLRRPDLNMLPEGRHVIGDGRVFAFISENTCRSRKECPLEAHHSYIDIQFVASGMDEIGWKLAAECIHVRSAYDAMKDIVFFNDMPDSWISVHAGHFAIFYPDDCHAPLAGSGRNRKVVVKVPVLW